MKQIKREELSQRKGWD